MWKRSKVDNKSSKCNTKFDDTYHLCKYNIGIDYHHIRKEIKNPYEKEKKLINKSNEHYTRFNDTYRLHKNNISINYSH